MVAGRLPVSGRAAERKVSIAATYCYTTAIDPAHPSDYTRSCLEVFILGWGFKSLVR